jgi:NOL1/NOP2/fmu family ribosome biogenesis protein
VYLVSKELDLLKSHVFSCGVKLGEIIKGRLVPHHRFFMAYGKVFKNRIDLSLDDSNVEKYLRGEEIPAPENLKGYCAVLCDGVTLGGAKVSSGIAKNHYPKGLRISGH